MHNMKWTSVYGDSKTFCLVTGFETTAIVLK